MFSAQYVALYIGFQAITLPFCLGDEKHHSVGFAPESRQNLPVMVIATQDYFSDLCTVIAAPKVLPNRALNRLTHSPYAMPFKIDGTVLPATARLQRGPIMHRIGSQFRLAPGRLRPLLLENRDSSEPTHSSDFPDATPCLGHRVPGVSPAQSQLGPRISVL